MHPNHLALITAAAGRVPDHPAALRALRFAAGKSASQLVRAVRAKLLRPAAMTRREARHHLLGATGWHQLKPAPNFLDASPDRWASFTEPQITGGWAYHLARRSRLARCQAVFETAWRERDVPAPQLDHVELIAAERGRIDLLIIGEDATGQRHCVCIEAKFGHALTDQLPGYEARLSRDHRIDHAEYRALMLIGAALRPDIARQLDGGGNWRFMSWKDWLIGYDNVLPVEADDDDFRRFRRTNLHRAAQELGHDR